MSLNWNIEKVENWKAKQRSQRNRVILDALIWSAMFVGISAITKKNYKKFYLRVSTFERINGAQMMKGKKPYYLTLEDVKNWIGLKTNVSDMTASQFEKRLIESISD